MIRSSIGRNIWPYSLPKSKPAPQGPDQIEFKSGETIFYSFPLIFDDAINICKAGTYAHYEHEGCH